MIEENNDDYHADHSYVSASMLKTFRKSPRLYEANYVTETIVRDAPSAAMRLGSLIHCAALEPDELEQRYVINKFDSRRTKAYKEWEAEEQREIISDSEMETAKRCCDSLYTHPHIKAILDSDGVVEHSFRWTCSDTGMNCKFRPDKLFVRDGQTVVVDLKTTADVDSYVRQSADFGYHIQQEHYLAGAELATGNSRLDTMFIFAVVETKAPYRVRAFQYDQDSSHIANEQRLQLLTDLAECIKTGDFSEDAEKEIVSISLPNWEKQQWLQSN
jgi:hypothetical protein